MPQKHYTMAEVVAALEDLCLAVGERRFLDTRDFPPDLHAELARRADDGIARQVDKANRILAWWKDHEDDDGDEGDDDLGWDGEE